MTRVSEGPDGKAMNEKTKKDVPSANMVVKRVEFVTSDGKTHTAKHYQVTVADQIRVVGDFRLRAKRPGRRRPFAEVRQRLKWGNDQQKNMMDEQSYYRDEDRRRHKVTDPDTGDVVYDDSGKLSEHREHGSAKFKKIP